ncbi:MAG: sortase [Candidatus Chisholmbacteria bacterium]|nr:sortase [Candidatus Chisholmbacteria bacterium]
MITKKFTSYLFAAVAGVCFLLASFLIWQHHTPSRLAFSVAEVGSLPSELRIESLPQTLLIPSQGIEVPIYPSQVRDGKWETTPKGVSYLVSTALPGNQGNSVIYGHNWANILGKLPDVETGQQVLLTWGDGRIERFEIVQTTEVTPDQTHILAPTDDVRLTIYTCSGFLDRKRFVIVAVPV